MVFVFGTLTWRGSILMVNPRASPRRSWLYLLIGALSVETDGVIQFTVGTVKSMWGPGSGLTVLVCGGWRKRIAVGRPIL